MTRLTAVVRNELRHMWRDPWLLTTVTVGAVALIVIMSYTLSADIEQVPIAIFDADRTDRSRDYLQRFTNDPFFDLAHRAQSSQAAYDHVVSGQAHGALVIPPGFAQTIVEGETARVQVIVDGTQPNVATQILGNAQALSSNFSVELLKREATRNGSAIRHAPMPLDLRTRALYNPSLESINSLLPGLMALGLSLPTISAALSVAREKETGTLEKLIGTPIRRYQLLAGKVIPYVLLGLADVLLFTAIGRVAYGIPFRGRLVELMLFSSLFLGANLGISLLISTLVRTQMAALVIAGLILTLPVINQSGLFHPLYAMPESARFQAMLWPATHYVIIARSIILKGVGLPTLLFNGLFLLGWGLALNGIALWRFKKKIA